MYFVKATYRANACDRHSRILGLVLDRQINGHTVFDLANLVEIARQGQLWVQLAPEAGCKSVRVEIFWSEQYGHWIARTEADSILCDNLGFLPIYQPVRSDGSTTYYQVCAL